MLSIAKVGGASGLRYYLAVLACLYYLANSEVTWSGEGAEKLGLRGPVKADAFRNLYEGKSPDGTRALVQNVGKERVAAWDLTFSAPKDFSTLWSQSSASRQSAIIACHDQAALKVTSTLEEACGMARIGKGGKEHVKAELVFAHITHFSSRAGDPQIHTHALCFNACFRPDGTTGSLYSKPLYEYKMAAGALYRAELASRLQRELGLEIVPSKDGFEIVGVSRELTARFSSRRQQIESYLEAKDLSGPIQSRIAAEETRPKKKDLPLDEMLESFRATGASLGWSTAEAEALFSQAPQSPQQDISEIVRKAREHLTETEGAFKEVDLIRETAIRAVGSGANVEAILAATKAELSGKHLAQIPQPKRSDLYASPENARLHDALTEHRVRVEKPTGETNPKPELGKRPASQETARPKPVDMPSVVPVRNIETATSLKNLASECQARGQTVLGSTASESDAKRFQAFLGAPFATHREIVSLGLVSLHLTHRRLFKTRTTLPHLNINIPRLRLKFENPILLIDTRKKTKWPEVWSFELLRVMGAKLVLLVDPSKRASSPVAWLIRQFAKPKVETAPRQRMERQDRTPEAGDRVHFQRDLPLFGVRKGAEATVLDVGNKKFRAKFSDGAEIQLPSSVIRYTRYLPWMAPLNGQKRKESKINPEPPPITHRPSHSL